MKKRKVSFRTLFSLALIQVLIVLLFLIMLNESKPVNLQKLNQETITVEAIKYEKVFSEYRLSAYCNSNQYIFTNLGSFAEYSDSALYI